jgi:hypothetical protein
VDLDGPFPKTKLLCPTDPIATTIYPVRKDHLDGAVVVAVVALLRRDAVDFASAAGTASASTARLAAAALMRLGGHASRDGGREEFLLFLNRRGTNGNGNGDGNSSGLHLDDSAL